MKESLSEYLRNRKPEIYDVPKYILNDINNFHQQELWNSLLGLPKELLTGVQTTQAKYIMKEKILTIRKVNISGKYIEFWFEEESDTFTDNELNELDVYLHSCKTGKFFDMIELMGLYTQVINSGVKGMKTKWVFSDFDNWNFDSIIL